MPLEAFEHLNAEKKEKLINAAIREFSDYPYERASVFNIAKNAGISRSGFYYYFVDKEDIYHYLLDMLCQDFERELNEETSILNLHRIFFAFFAKFKGTERQNLIFRVLENMKPAVQDLFVSTLNRPGMRAHIVFRDTYKLKTSDRQDNGFYVVTSINCTMHALKAYYETDIPVEKILERLDRYMEYLKFGVVKEEFRNEC